MKNKEKIFTKNKQGTSAKKKRIRNTILLLLLFPLGLALTYLSASFPTHTEKFYSVGIGKILNEILSTITGFLPLPIGEVMVYITVLFLTWLLLKYIFKMIQCRKNKRFILYKAGLKLLVFFSVVYFAFVVLWGLNYHRLSFAQITKMNVTPATVKELSAVCENLIIRGNEQRSKVHQDSTGIMELSYSKSEMLSRASKGYVIAAKNRPELGGTYGNPKGVLFPKVLSYSGIEGIYCPFTGEANINLDLPAPVLPSATCHEMAHQRGFAREDEANYISYLTCTLHSDIDFQYSGTLLALLHSMNALYDHDPNKYATLKKTYSVGLNADLENIHKFWTKYEGPIEKASSKMNNTYLKSNMQKDGIYSYGRVVDLLIAEYRAKASK